MAESRHGMASENLLYTAPWRKAYGSWTMGAAWAVLFIEKYETGP
jgi:hypothetical protein